MNEKGFSNVVVGIIAAVSLIAAGAYFLLTQKQETQKTTDANNVTNTSVIDCGVEDNHGVGYDKQARGCFFEAYSTCTPAKFVGTNYSIEGGRFISTLSITGAKDGRCEIFKELDASDYWALGKKLSGYCYGLESTDILSPEGKNQLFFDLKECDSSLENQTVN